MHRQSIERTPLLCRQDDIVGCGRARIALLHHHKSAILHCWHDWIVHDQHVVHSHWPNGIHRRRSQQLVAGQALGRGSNVDANCRSPRRPSQVQMVGLQALRAVEHERCRADECQHECQQLCPPLGAQLDWQHTQRLHIGLAGALASAADRSAACEVAAATVAATPRASAATVSASQRRHTLRLPPPYSQPSLAEAPSEAARHGCWA